MRGHAITYWLKYPEGYHVIVEDDGFPILCRPDGTEVWRFDPGAVFECEILLAAFEDHSNLLMLASSVEGIVKVRSGCSRIGAFKEKEVLVSRSSSLYRRHRFPGEIISYCI